MISYLTLQSFVDDLSSADTIQRSAIPGIGIEVLTSVLVLVLVLGIDLGHLEVLVLVLGIDLSHLEVSVLVLTSRDLVLLTSGSGTIMAVEEICIFPQGGTQGSDNSPISPRCKLPRRWKKFPGGWRCVKCPRQKQWVYSNRQWVCRKNTSTILDLVENKELEYA